MKLEIVQIVNSCKSTPVQTIFFYPGHPLDHLVSLIISHLVNLSNEEKNRGRVWGQGFIVFMESL